MGIGKQRPLEIRVLEPLHEREHIAAPAPDAARPLLFRGIQTVRVNDTFDRPEMATDLMESDLAKLNVLYQEGGESFAKHEAALKLLLDCQQPQTNAGRPS